MSGTIKGVCLLLLASSLSFGSYAQSDENVERQLRQQREALEQLQKENKKELKKLGLKSNTSARPAKAGKVDETRKLLDEIAALQSAEIPLLLENAHSFSEGLAAVCFNGKWGFVDTSGNFIIAPVHLPNRDKNCNHLRFSEGLVRFGESFVGFMDKEGKEVIRRKYNNASGWDAGNGFSEGLSMITEGAKARGNKGFIDKTGKKVVPVKYDYVKDFSEGLAAVAIIGESDNLYGYIDKTGKMVIPQRYFRANSFSEGLAAVAMGKDTKYWGFIDKTGTEVIPCKYERTKHTLEAEFRFSEGLAAVVLNKKFGFIDKQGNEVVPFIYDEAEAFSEGLASVKSGGKWGFIDKKGKEVIPPQYEFVRSFSEGLAVVKVREGGIAKYGFIDKSGKMTISPIACDNALSFSNGRALLKGVEGFFPKSNEDALKLLLAKREGREFNGELVPVKLNAVFIDKTGREVIR